MAQMNEGFLSLQESYLFIEISKRINAYKSLHKDAEIIRLGIGDVTQPLAPVVVEAMQKACLEQGSAETFHGYEDSGRGYDFLKNAVAGYYKSHNVEINADELFITDGAKSDTGNIVDIFGNDNVVLIADPAYPVYVDSNIMASHKIIYVDANEDNNFLAMPDFSIKADLIYLCSPNNPTGACYTKEQLKIWVDYALQNDAIIVFDAAYEAYITDKTLPRSIFEIEGSRNCAIEMCSLSKTAGFTGTRCGYTVIPKTLWLTAPNGEKVNLYKLWARRQGSKFNGVSYPVQRGAEAVFTEIGQKQIQVAIDYYRENATTIMETFDKLGYKYTGGKNSPYIWFKCPSNFKSFEYFDYLLENLQIVGTPGAGFGKNGEGWFRLTCFGNHLNTKKAMQRLLSAKKEL